MKQFVPKSELFDQFKVIFLQKESGMLSLLTDAKKSVLMRFSDGELTSARCRSWNLENTISALLEADKVKFSYAPGRGDDKPALIAANDFMLMIDPGGSGLQETDSGDEPTGVESTIAELLFAPEPAPENQDDEAEQEKDAYEVDKVTAARMNYF